MNEKKIPIAVFTFTSLKEHPRNEDAAMEITPLQCESTKTLEPSTIVS